MSSQEKWSFEPPLYFLHLAGGIRLLVGSNGQSAFMTAHANKFITFDVSPFTTVVALVDELSGKLNIPCSHVFGFQKFNSTEDLERRISESFNYVLPSNIHERNPINHVSNWLAIASNSQSGNQSAVCKRIATQIQRAVHRACALSDCYMNTLHQQSEVPEEGTISLINNYNSQKIGLEFTSLLDNLYYLRDALNIFVFRFLTDESVSFKTKSLLRILKDMDSNLSNLLLSGMNRADGCVKRFSTLRGVAQHSMGRVNPTFEDCYSLRKIEAIDGYLYRLIFPLYDDWDALEKIEKDASKGIFPTIPKKEYERYFSEAENHVDAFDFDGSAFTS